MTSEELAAEPLGRLDRLAGILEDIAARITQLLDEMSVRDAAKAAAESFGIPKGRAYDMALRLKQATRVRDDD